MIVAVVFRYIDSSCVEPICDATAKSVHDAVFNVVFLHSLLHVVNCFPSPLESCWVIAPYNVFRCFLGSAQTTFICVLVLVHGVEFQGGGK